jgi:hypothetical protein
MYGLAEEDLEEDVMLYLLKFIGSPIPSEGRRNVAFAYAPLERVVAH